MSQFWGGNIPSWLIFPAWLDRKFFEKVAFDDFYSRSPTDYGIQSI